MTTLTEIANIIKETGVVADWSKFDPAKTFKQNNIDSLDVFTIFLAIEEQLGVQFSEEESLQLKSAAEICNFLNSR